MRRASGPQASAIPIKAARDLIKHHCRCCQHGWVSKPLAPARRRTYILRCSAMKWWRVEVSDHDGQIVAIEPGMLAGRDIGPTEREAIEHAIANLSGFIGLPDQPSGDA